MAANSLPLTHTHTHTVFQGVCSYHMCVDAEGIICDSLWRFPQEEVCVCVCDIWRRQ